MGKPNLHQVVGLAVPQPPPKTHSLFKWIVLLTLVFTLTTFLNAPGFVSNVSLFTNKFTTSVWEVKFGSGVTCHAPAPNLFAYHPPRLSNERIVKASKDLDKYLSDRASKSDIDSISVSVVTAAGPIFEGGYGTLKANETDTNPDDVRPVDRDSIYRIASISKMFTVLETLILRERGVLNWWVISCTLLLFPPTFSF